MFMLRLLFTSTLFILLQTASAQIQLGIKAGVNISNFNGGNFENIEKEALVQPHGGAYIRLGLGPTLKLQPELLFSVQGAKLKSATEEFDAKISYLNIPIMLQFYTAGGFYIEGGPQVGFKIDEDTPDQSTEDFAESSDFAIALGLGYQMKGGFGIGGRYTIGVSKVGNQTIVEDDFHNGVIQFSLFYTFGGKK
jgi:hypothetical protein